MILHNDTLQLQELTALFQPFSSCDEYINIHFFKVNICIYNGGPLALRLHYVMTYPTAFT